MHVMLFLLSPQKLVVVLLRHTDAMCRHTALPTIMQLQYPMTSQSAQQPHQVVASQVANGQTAANQSAIAATLFDQSQQPQQGRSHQVRFEKKTRKNINVFIGNLLSLF